MRHKKSKCHKCSTKLFDLIAENAFNVSKAKSFCLQAVENRAFETVKISFFSERSRSTSSPRSRSVPQAARPGQM
jgi:hypothetical protein